MKLSPLSQAVRQHMTTEYCRRHFLYSFTPATVSAFSLSNYLYLCVFKKSEGNVIMKRCAPITHRRIGGDVKRSCRVGQLLMFMSHELELRDYVSS